MWGGCGRHELDRHTRVCKGAPALPLEMMDGDGGASQAGQMQLL